MVARHYRAVGYRDVRTAMRVRPGTPGAIIVLPCSKIVDDDILSCGDHKQDLHGSREELSAARRVPGLPRYSRSWIVRHFFT